MFFKYTLKLGSTVFIASFVYVNFFSEIMNRLSIVRLVYIY